MHFNEKKKPWVEWYRDEDFDVPMWYDEPEVFELVGSYQLKKVPNIVNKKFIGLYRDDGLAILRNFSGPQIEWKRKDTIKMFKTVGLNTAIQAGLHNLKFLDVQFNLNNDTYRNIGIEKTSHTENLTTRLFTSGKHLTSHQ